MRVRKAKEGIRYAYTSLYYPGFPRWRCVFLTMVVKYDIKINAVLPI